jgi:hypothetical protein
MSSNAMAVIKQHYRPVSIASALLGVALVLLAELAHTDWTKIFGAIFVSLGAVGIGIRYGLAAKTPSERLRWLARARADVGALVAVLLVGPSLAALLLSLIGPRGLELLTSPVGAIGLRLNLLLAIASVLTLRIAIGAWTRATRSASEPAGEGH